MQHLCDIHPESKMKEGFYYNFDSGMIWIQDEVIYFHEHERKHCLNPVDYFEIYYRDLGLKYESMVELSLKEIKYMRQHVSKMRNNIKIERYVCGVS